MKIKLEFDITPAEFREALGLPDVSGLQEEVIEALQSRLKDTVENYDPTTMIKGWIEGGIGTVSEVQRAITSLFGKATVSRASSESNSRPPTPERVPSRKPAKASTRKKASSRKKKTKRT